MHPTIYLRFSLILVLLSNIPFSASQELAQEQPIGEINYYYQHEERSHQMKHHEPPQDSNGQVRYYHEESHQEVSGEELNYYHEVIFYPQPLQLDDPWTLAAPKSIGTVWYPSSTSQTRVIFATMTEDEGAKSFDDGLRAEPTEFDALFEDDREFPVFPDQ